MKSLKHLRVFIPIIILTFFIAQPAFTQDKNEVAELKIKSSVVCGMCKTRVEKDLAFEKGVTYVSVDLKSREVTVKYRTAKTEPDKIRKALTKIGYDADNLLADQKAYDKLPACCKKDAAPH